jgi:hypothetical protein
MQMNMDIELTMLNFTNKQLLNYINMIKQSNIDRVIQSELIDLLETVMVQVGQARKMGWLP